MIRILSDLHLHGAFTQIRSLRQLEPLLHDVRTLVLNGDSCEMRRGVTPAQVGALKEFCTARVPEVVFITGNHDPDISDTHEWLGAKGRVWVTHGDVCLDGLTPWSRRAAELRRQIAAHLAEQTADYARLDVRFHIARTVARAEQNIPDCSAAEWHARVGWLWRTFLPPRQILAMFHAWRDLPKKAAALAIEHRSTAQVVVLGHSHCPGVWRMNRGPVIVNTGSFFRPLGGNLVDVFGDRVEVRRIGCKDGSFRPGRLVAEIPLRGADA